jgi:hypothetical protein
MPAQTAASMDTFVNVNGSVVAPVSTGYNPQLLVLTQNPILPTGTVQQFSSLAAVTSYFGNTTNPNDTTFQYVDGTNARYYFAGSQNKGNGQKPSSILFYRYVSANTPAFTRGSSLSLSTDLALLQAVTAGTLNLNFNGVSTAVTGINLAGKASFLAMAATIQTAIQAVAGFSGALVTFDTTTNAFTITFPYTGANTVSYITNSASLGADQLAQKMKITLSTGAILSQGLAAQTPAQIMTSIINLSQNWFTVICNFDVNSDPNYAIVLGITAWNASQTQPFLPLFYDTIGGTTSPITAPLKTVLINAGYGQNTVTPWTLNTNIKEFIINPTTIGLIFGVAGTLASNNFDATNGNGIIQLNSTIYPGITPIITNQSDLDLLLNTYNSNSYINLNTRANNFQWFQTGVIGGNYNFADIYLGYTWIRDQCQYNIANLMQSVNSIPYNRLSIVNAVLEPIFTLGLQNGTVQNNIQLSDSEKQTLISQAGYDISPILYNTGYFIAPITASATDIANRTLSGVNIWYTYAGGPIYITVNVTTVI